jgi:hypothetical protein
MPFSGTETVPKDEDWNKIYEDFFIPVWNEVDFECERTNVKRGSITKDIIEKCFAADLVMADLTDTNPNVMYELGLRHTFKKPSLMVKQKGCKIPFDVNDYKVHEYENTSTGLRQFKELIKEVVDDLDNNPEKPDNPVWDLIHFGGFMIDYYNRIETINKLKALLKELNDDKNTFKEIIRKFEDPKIELKQGEYGLDLLKLSTDCLSLLITTQYIPFEEKNWNSIIELKQMCNLHIRTGHLFASSWGFKDIINEGKGNIGFLKDVLIEIDKIIEIIEKRIDEIKSNVL